MTQESVILLLSPTPFLSMSAVPDHISPSSLILTFRTPHVIAPAISPRFPFSPSHFLPPLLFLCICLLRHFSFISFSSLCKNYVAQNATRIKFFRIRDKNKLSTKQDPSYIASHCTNIWRLPSVGWQDYVNKK